MHNHCGPFSIPDIRNFIPEKVKPWILVAFVIVYQLSGGIYLASVSEMSGTMALMHQDIMMAGYASLVGMALTFTIMFRLKFRFSIKNSLMTSATGLIICNLICLHTHSIPVLIATCFAAGFFRMWGTFSCNTTIQLWITPARDMPVWFCFINLLVLSGIQISGMSTVFTAGLCKWEYMHWFIIGLLLCVLFVTFFSFRHYHSMKKLSLRGIDFMGMFLWGITILCAIFVLNYGDHFDWYQSIYIRIGTISGLATLALNLWRASFISHPFIELKIWRYRNIWLTFVLFIAVNILLSPSRLFEQIYNETILGYDALNAISLNWAVLMGIVCGVFFSYQFFALRKCTYKSMTLIGFSLVLSYLLLMYFNIDSNLPKGMLVLPLFLRGMGYAVIAITFITAISSIPFENFFQALSAQTFISACLGSLIGNTILEYFYKLTVNKNIMLLGTNLDNLNPLAKQIPADELFNRLQLQSIIVSMKEIYGLLCLLGFFILMVFFLKESTLRPKTIFPKFRTIRRLVKHQIRMDKVSAEK